MHASPPGKGGQRPSACISSRITTVIQVGEERATKGTITDLMSHSQFHCTGRAYLDMHGLIFETRDRKSTRLNSSHTVISYAVFCLKKKKKKSKPKHSRQIHIVID